MIPRNELGHLNGIVDKFAFGTSIPGPAQHTPYEIARWADDIERYDRYNFTKPWHFFNQPVDEKYCSQAFWKDYKKNILKNNVVIGLENTLRGLNNTNREHKFTKGEWLRFLIHWIGDLHMPLNSATRCSKIDHERDKGGNKIYVKITRQEEKTKVFNFHHLWDITLGALDLSSFYSIEKEIIHILFSEDEDNPQYKPAPFDVLKKYMQISNELMEQYPRSHFRNEQKKKNFWNMAKKMRDIAQDYNYNGVRTNSKEGNEQLLSEEYVKRGINKCFELIALTGYRLHDFIKQAMEQLTIISLF